MTTEEIVQLATYAGAYLLFLWCLTWPVRHSAWVQRMRFEAYRRHSLRWQDQHGGR